MADDTPQVPDLAQLVGDEAAEQAAAAHRPIPTWALVLMAVGLVIAALILYRIAGPLFRLVFPSDILVPDGVEEVEHNTPDKGSEYWVFRTNLSGREVAAFYEEEGGEQPNCKLTPLPAPGTPRGQGPYSVGTCRGSTPDYTWEVFIAEGYPEAEGPTIFRIYKYASLSW